MYESETTPAILDNMLQFEERCFKAKKISTTEKRC